MNKLQRFTSFILAMLMTISTLVPTYAVGSGSNLNQEQGGGHSGTTTGVANTTAHDTTGYKISLVFLAVEGIENAKDEAERNAMLEEAWDKANPGDAIKIGKTIYLTDSQSSKESIKNGFRYDGFQYGLGTKTDDEKKKNNTGEPDIKSITSDIIVTPYRINMIMNALNPASLGSSTKVKYTKDSMKMEDTIPIKIGGNQHNPKTLDTYFMSLRSEEDKKNDTDITGREYATPNFAALVNYIATNAGTYPEDFIYFARIAYPGGRIGNYSDLIPEGANCFESGCYRGMYGEIRMIIEPYWGIRTALKGGEVGAYTLRDLAFLYNYGGEYKQIATDQTPYMGDLGYTTRLRTNDIWDLEESDRNHWEGQPAKEITALIKENKGGGLGFITSSMMYMPPKLQDTYIGSISHIFLPGSLKSDQKDIQTASMEYIGPKGDNNSLQSAMEKAAIQIAKAFAGGTTEKDNNVYGNDNFTQEVLLNGTIKLPGLRANNATTGKITSFNETNGYAGTNQAELIKRLEETINNYADSEEVRKGIRDTLYDELGIDFNNPANSAVNMQDFNLAVYCLTRYQQFGVEANEDGWNTPDPDSAINRWKQILAYQAMLINEKSKATIANSAKEGGNWKGALSITEDDIKHYTTGKHVLDSTPLGTTYNNLKSYSNTAEGADEAIKDDVLDNTTTGQISGETTNWQEILKAGSLGNGLVRIPIAMGSTQLYLGSGEDGKDPVNVTKGAIPSLTSAFIKSAVNAYLPDSGSENYTDVNLYKGITGLFDPTGLLDPTDMGMETLLNTTGNLDKVSTFAQGTDTVKYMSASGNDTLFKSIAKNASFNASYGENSMHNGKNIESYSFNPFGINMLVNVGIACTLAGYRLQDNSSLASYYHDEMIHSNPDINIDNSALDFGTQNPEGMIAVPSYIYNAASSENPTLQEVAATYAAKLEDMRKDTTTVGDAVFANTSNNDSSLILAVNNYVLSQSLANTAAKIRTTKAAKADKASTSMTGDYGAGYVIWDTAIPVDIQFVTEYNGKILPIEGATKQFDNGLISNVWYASPNLDKALQLQKYYTIKDKNGNDVTLEVEEAVVKSATVNTPDTLKEFYDGYTKAYNSNNKGYFSYEGTDPTDSNKTVTYNTKRTIFDKTANDKSNVSTYIRTHDEFEGSASLRYISASGSNLGSPMPLTSLTNTTVNTIDIVPSVKDKEAFIQDNTGSRLQVIVKVKASQTIKQYNMIIGLTGNYVEEVEPEIEDGKVKLSQTIKTSTGYAKLSPSAGPDNDYTPKYQTVVITDKDINPNDEEPDWKFEDFMQSTKNEGGKDKYRLVRPYDPYTHPDWENKVVDDPTTAIGGTSNLDTIVELPPKSKAIYVRYVETPPVYEVYRDANGNEQVVTKAQVWGDYEFYVDNSNRGIGPALKVSSGVNGDNAIGSQNTWYPVMAVAANIDFGVTNSTDAITIDSETKTKTLNTPDNWQWVLDNLTDLGKKSVKYIGGSSANKGKEISTSSLGSQDPDKQGKSMGQFRDVQTIGLNGLYHTTDGNPITLTSIIEGSFGLAIRSRSRGSTNIYSYHRDFGYAKKQEQFTTKEEGTVQLWNSRIANPDISKSATGKFNDTTTTNPYLASTSLTVNNSGKNDTWYPAAGYSNYGTRYIEGDKYHKYIKEYTLQLCYQKRYLN